MRRGEFGEFKRTAAYRHAISREYPRAHPLLHYFRGNATMNEDYRKLSREALARANQISEIAILWALVFTVVVVVSAMIKGMLG